MKRDFDKVHDAYNFVFGKASGIWEIEIIQKANFAC